MRFYLDQLGFRLAFDARLPSGQRWVAVAPPDGSAVLSLIAPRPTSPEHKLIGRPTQVVFVTEDVVAKFREWHQRGVRFRHTPRLRRVKYERGGPVGTTPAAATLSEAQAPVWGAVFTRFEDVDGNSFSLVSFDEESRAVEAQRRAAAEKLESEREPRTSWRSLDRCRRGSFRRGSRPPARSSTRGCASRRARSAVTTTIS